MQQQRSKDLLNKQRSTYQQSLGDMQVHGDDNILNVVQAERVTLTQNKIIQISVDEIKTRSFVPVSPYKGLRNFEPEDKDRFFGRDQFLANLVNELEQTNLVLLLGASGSGKSSVVRAGLVPWLSQKWGTRLVNLTLTPDQDPFESLYGSLLSRFKQSEAQVARIGQVDTLSQVVKCLKPPDDFWFIFIDQFEELFTVSEPERRDRFITSLANLCKEKGCDRTLKIVATMRADFLERLDAAPANSLARLTEKHRPLMTQMHPDELRLAIEQPAAHHGVVFETGLVETIIKDVQGQAGYLPLLQYTLNQLWESEVHDGNIHNRTLNIQSYRLSGGVRGALQKRMSQIYDALTEPEKLAAQRIFLRLVGVGGNSTTDTEWKPVRKREVRSRFTDDLEQAVLIQLIDANLLVSDASTANAKSEATVEIAHEILLTSWDELRDWIKQNCAAIALRNRINEDVAHWKLEKLDDELWSGTKLAQAVDLHNNLTFNHVLGGFSPEVTEFIDCSVGLRDRQQNEKEARRQRELAHERKARKSAQKMTVSIAIASVLVSVLGILSGFQWRQAEIGQIEALTQSSNANFTADRISIDGLIDALEAGKRLQKLPFGTAKQEHQAKVLETLAKSIAWVREKNRLQGHGGSIRDIDFSPDGEKLVTGSFDKTIKLWQRDGTLLKTLEGHTDTVTTVRFSPDSQTIVSGSFDGTAKLWNSDGSLIQTISAHSGSWVMDVAFSPDGRLATASNDGTVRLWRPENEQLLTTLNGHQALVRQVKFSPNGDQIITVGDDSTVKLWSWDGKTLLKTLNHHSHAVTSIDFSRNGQLFVTGSQDGTVKLWSLEGQLLNSFTSSGEVWSVEFSGDGQTIVSASADGTISLWTQNGDLLDTWSAHDSAIYSIAFDPSGKTFATAGKDLNAKLWQVNRDHIKLLTGHQDNVTWVTFSPDGNRIASTSADGTVKIWNQKAELLSTLEGHNGKAYTVSFHPTNNVIASGGEDGTIRLWSDDGQLQQVLKGHQDSVLAINFSQDGQILASASADYTARIWDLKSKESILLKGHEDRVLSVALSPDGQTIATAGDDNTVILWSASGKELKRLTGHTDVIRYVGFGPDGEMLITASDDTTVGLWQQDGTLVKTLNGHMNGVMGASASPDGRTVASVSSDGTAKLWQLNGELITTLDGYEDIIYATNFSPNSRWLAFGGAAQTVLLWQVSNINLSDLLEEGCSYASDYLKSQSQSSAKLCD